MGKTPEDHATDRGHGAVVDWLRSCYRLGTTRGGSGGAFYEAMEDKRSVIKVEWHRLEWPGIVKSSLFLGWLGSCVMWMWYGL